MTTRKDRLLVHLRVCEVVVNIFNHSLLLPLLSGQLLATSHDLGLEKVATGTPAISGKSSLVKYHIMGI